jgi:hypothetical protein
VEKRQNKEFELEERRNRILISAAYFWIKALPTWKKKK